MKIILRILTTAALIVVIASCGNEKEASKLLGEAKAFYLKSDFITAKHLIDSVNLMFPREIKVRREALTLMRLVNKGESEQNIAYCDSLLPIRIAELDGLKKGFVFEKDSAYDEQGTYIWKAMTVEKNVERSYIRCGVNEEGEMYMASVFFGGKPLEHTGLKLSVKDGAYAQTPAIPYDGGVNYRFKDNGNTTEVVTYKGENCKTIANFVVIIDPKERIKAEYTGGKPFSLYLSDVDKTAIKATYELAMTLSEINNLKKIKDKSEKVIQLIDSKLNNEAGKENEETK